MWWEARRRWENPQCSQNNPPGALGLLEGRPAGPPGQPPAWGLAICSSLSCPRPGRSFQNRQREAAAWTPAAVLHFSSQRSFIGRPPPRVLFVSDSSETIGRVPCAGASLSDPLAVALKQPVQTHYFSVRHFRRRSPLVFRKKGKKKVCARRCPSARAPQMAALGRGEGRDRPAVPDASAASRE